MSAPVSHLNFAQIPGDEDDGSAVSQEEELTRRFKDVMRRIFWDRFTQSLMPPPPNVTAEDEAGGIETLREGSKVHARYGSERGSFYAATVLSVTKGNQGSGGRGGAMAKGSAQDRAEAGAGGVAISDEGVVVDVRYDEDGIVERGIPASRLKKSGDSPDFGPLLALLGEVRGRPLSGRKGARSTA